MYIRLTPHSKSIKHLCTSDNLLVRVIDIMGPISYHTYDDPYVFLVNTIIGQMLSKKVAVVISKRVEALCNGNLTPDRVLSLNKEQLRAVGLSYSKIEYLYCLSTAVIERKINFDLISNMNDKEAIAVLTSIRGIGIWSAKMYLIFVLNRENILPYEDVAFLQGLAWLLSCDAKELTRKKVIRYCKKWEPYTSIAARYLYRALDYGYTKQPIQSLDPSSIEE